MKYFGTDGIRGKPNQDLSLELVFKIGKALKCLDKKQVVVATDTRVSKDLLGYALASGCLAEGLEVLYAGISSTPALIYYSYRHRVIGVMITASHNPYTDNGIKILNAGYKLNESEESKIEELIDNPLPVIHSFETLQYLNGLDSQYINHLKPLLSKSNLKIAIDCANGAAFKLAPQIFKEITNDLVIINNNPNGYNINHDCGSTHLESLKKAVISKKCDIGFAFDGDADRVMAVDNEGRILDGDFLIYILACYLKSNGELNNNQVVMTIMSNLGVINALKKKKIDVIETNVGDKFVSKVLLANGLALGGENSGHIIVSKYSHTGDGILVAALIIKILDNDIRKLKKYRKEIKYYADKMINIAVENKEKVLNNKNLNLKIASIKKSLNNDCKVIVRASGTEKLIRLSIMAKEQKLVDYYINELLEEVRKIG